MTISTSVHELKTLALSYHPVIVIETAEEERARALLASVAADLRVALWEWSMTKGLSRYPATTPIYGTSDPLQVIATLGDISADGIYLLKDFTKHLSTAALARRFRDAIEERSKSGRLSTVVLTGTEIAISSELAPSVVHYELRLPEESEYRQTIAAVIQSLVGERRTTVEIDAAGMGALTKAVTGMTLNQARQAVAYAALENGKLTAEEAQAIVRAKAQALRDDGLLEYFPVEDNRFQLGGFAGLKVWLARARIGFTSEAQALNLTPPRGIMLVGVSGCGKSLAAKVISREWEMPLVKLDAGSLYDKYIGESERNLRKATALAESMAPVVLWIDEIEKGFASTGGGEGDGGLSRRLFGAFLTWLQEKRDDVFVVATANNLDLLPPELLRKGRFDEIFFVDLPDADERATILTIHLELRKQDPKIFDLPRLTTATDGFSGAEIEQTVIAALYRALHDKRSLDSDLLLEAIEATVPLSVTRREEVERLRTMAVGRFVPVR